MYPTSIDKMDPKVREEINRLRIDNGFTIEQIVEHLKTMGVTVSKSVMGRHVLKIDDVGRRIREARAIAEGLAPTLANKDDGQLINLNVELLQSAAMRLLSATDDKGEDVQLTAMQAQQIGKALEASSKAQAINANRVLKVRKETAQKVAAEVGKMAKAEGWSADTVARVREHILKVA